MSYLIKDTTEEERRKIVEESLGNLSGACDGCSARVADMYDAYIRGEMELRDINMAFSTRYVKGGMEREPRSSCQIKSCQKNRSPDTHHFSFLNAILNTFAISGI